MEEPHHEHEDIKAAKSDHDLLIIVAHDVKRLISTVKAQNHRIGALERWQLRVIYGGGGAALLISPLAFVGVREWLSQILVGG